MFDKMKKHISNWVVVEIITKKFFLSSGSVEDVPPAMEIRTVQTMDDKMIELSVEEMVGLRNFLNSNEVTSFLNDFRMD